MIIFSLEFWNIISTNFLTLYNILTQEQNCFTISEISEMLCFSVYSLNKLCLKMRFVIYCMQRPFWIFCQGLFVKKERNLDKAEKTGGQIYCTANCAQYWEAGHSQASSSCKRRRSSDKKKRLCCGLLFEVILIRIKGFLEDAVWHGKAPTNGAINIDECTEFPRLWSTLHVV